MRSRIIIAIAGFLLAASLAGGLAQTGMAQTAQTAQTEESSGVSGKEFARQGLLSNDWFQTAGEARGLYYQGYASGREKLAADLRDNPQNPAVVLDIDATVLNDGPYESFLIKSGEQFPYKYDEWIEAAEAEAMPGALNFLKYADSKGVDIYYVSGREVSDLDPTVENLQRVGAPQATDKHVLLTKPEDEGKDSRFDRVAKTHQTLLYFGDNLGDFPGFGGETLEDRNQMTDQQAARFGEKYIVFPNPMYGDWESALYGSAEDPDEAQKTRLREENLRVFDPGSAPSESASANAAASSQAESEEVESIPETGGAGLPAPVSLAGAAFLGLGVLGLSWKSLRSRRG